MDGILMVSDMCDLVVKIENCSNPIGCSYIPKGLELHSKKANCEANSYALPIVNS